MDMKAFIRDAIKQGASIDDLAASFTDALNTYEQEQKKLEEEERIVAEKAKFNAARDQYFHELWDTFDAAVESGEIFNHDVAAMLTIICMSDTDIGATMSESELREYYDWCCAVCEAMPQTFKDSKKLAYAIDDFAKEVADALSDNKSKEVKVETNVDVDKFAERVNHISLDELYSPIDVGKIASFVKSIFD